MSDVLIPPRNGGWRPEGQPIPAPTYLLGGVADHQALFGDCHRVVVIDGCLHDVLAAEPAATAYRVAEWIDAYLTYYDKLRASTSEQEPT